jgi:Na+/melibiose symporter-like transporter
MTSGAPSAGMASGRIRNNASVEESASVISIRSALAFILLQEKAAKISKRKSFCIVLMVPCAIRFSTWKLRYSEVSFGAKFLEMCFFGAMHVFGAGRENSCHFKGF